MKTLLKLIYITIIICVVSSIYLVVSKANSNITEKDVEVYNEPVDFYKKYKSLEIIKKEESFYILKNGEKSELLLNICDMIENGNYIYILDEKTLYKLNEESLKLTKASLNIDKGNSLVLYNNNIVIGGVKSGNVCLQVFDLNLNQTDLIYFDGAPYEECTKLKVINESIYIMGIKDAHVDNRFFKNVGNKGEIKSFIFRLNSEFQIINELYLNEHAEKEELIDIIENNDYLYVQLQTDKETFIYEVDEALNIFTLNKIKERNIKLIKTNKQKNNQILYISFFIDSFSLMVKTKDEVFELTRIDGIYIDDYIENGSLNFIVKKEQTIRKNISEYHIDYINPLICDFLQNDETSLNHFSIDSYFEDLYFSIESITPFFNKTMFGEYVVTYQAVRENGEIFTFNTPLIVRPYVNIKQNGVYASGTRLYFFGKAKLNGKDVLNGVMLTEGDYTLELSSCNDHIITYKFTVVDGFYREGGVLNIDTTYTIDEGSKLYLAIDKNVKEVIFDNNEVGKIWILNDKRFLEISPTLDDLVKKYTIKELRLNNDEIIPYNFSFTVRTKKESPEYEITESKEKKSLRLDFEIKDPNLSVDDIYVEVIQNGKKMLYNTYLLEKTIRIQNLLAGDAFTILLKAKDDEDREVLLFKYIGKLLRQEDINLEFNSSNDGTTHSGYVLLDLSSPKLLHKEITVGTSATNLSAKYQVKISNLILFISLGATALIIGFTVFFVRAKKRANKS